MKKILCFFMIVGTFLVCSNVVFAHSEFFIDGIIADNDLDESNDSEDSNDSNNSTDSDGSSGGNHFGKQEIRLFLELQNVPLFSRILMVPLMNLENLFKIFLH